MEIRPAAREFESLPEFVALSPEEKIQFIESVSADMDENDKKFFIDRGNRALEESTRADGTGRLFRQDKVGSVIKDVLPSDFSNLGKDQQLEAIEKAREVVEDKALEVDPVNRNDTAYFADTQLGRLVREVQKDDVGEVGDKFNRFAGGLIQSVFAPFSEQGTREFLEMNLPTNPDYDTTAASKFTQAAGDFVGQIGQFFAISAFATPATAIGAGFAQNASRKFQENYDLAKGEMGLGDDEALAAGIAGAPGAVIDSLGDALLLKGIKLGSLGKSFKSMTAAEKAAEIVKKGGSVLRDPSMMRSITAQAAKGALLEGTSETLGDAATGWGGYATSGHEGFKPSAESLWDSFWIGGVLGGLAGGALNSRAANRDTKALRQLWQMNQEEFLKLGSETQQQIADFMDSGEYSKALELVGQFKQETAPSAPQGGQATAAPADAQTPADQAAPKLDDNGQPIPRTDAELAAARALVEDAVAGNLDNIKFANENPETKARFETIRNAVPTVMKTLRALLSPEAEFKMTLDGVNEAINQARTPSADPAAQQPQSPEAKPKRKTKAERMAEIRSRLESAIDELINKSDAPTPDQEGDTKDNEIMNSLGNFPSEDLPAMVDDIQTINQEYQQPAKADGETLKDSLLRRVDRMESLARYKGVVLGKAASVNAAKVIATGLRNKINQAPDDAALGEVNSEIDQLAQDGKVVNQDEVTQMVDKLKSTDGFADAEAQLNVQEQQPSGMLFQGAQGTPAAEINPLLTGLTPEQLDTLESVVNALRELGIDETVKEADRELAMEIRKAVAVGEMSDELNDKLNANAPSRAIFHNKLMKLKGFGDTTKRNVMMQQDVIALNYLRTGKSMQAYWAKVPDVIVIDEKGYEGAQGAFIPDNAFSPSEAVEDAAGIMRPRTISVTDETADDRSAPLAAPIPNTIVLVRGYYNASTILHENDHNLIATGMVQEILDATDPALYDELLTELGLARGQQWTIGAHEKYARAREAWIRGGEVKSIFRKVFDALKGIFTNLYADGVLDKFRNPVLEKAFAEIYDIQDLPKKKLTDKIARDYGYEASKLVGHVPIRKLAKAQNFMETAKLEPSYDAAKLLLKKLATTMDSGTPAFTEPEHQAMQDVLRMVMVGEAPVMAEPVIPTSSYVRMTPREMLEQGIITQGEYNAYIRPSTFGLTPEQLLERGIISQGEYNATQLPSITGLTPEQLLEQGVITQGEYNASQRILSVGLAIPQGFLASPASGIINADTRLAAAMLPSTMNFGLMTPPSSVTIARWKDKGMDNDDVIDVFGYELKDGEKLAMAAEVGEPTWNESARKKAAEMFSDWMAGIGQFSEKLKALFTRILKAIRSIGVGIGVIVTPMASQEVRSMSFEDIQPQQRQEAFQSRLNPARVQERPQASGMPDTLSLPEIEVNIPEFTGTGNAKTLHSWVVRNEDNRIKDEGRRPFIIADKTNGKVYLFDKEGNALMDAPALFGKDKADINTGKIPTMEELDAGAYGKITPSGKFNAGTVAENVFKGAPYEAGLTGLSPINAEQERYFAETLIAIHEIYTSDPSENRMQRMKSKSPEDNRISFGCINLLPKDNKQVVSVMENGGVVYVLPETKAGKSTFKGFEGLDDSILFQRSGVTQQDADYLAAVEAGDMEAAQRMVDEAAKMSGDPEALLEITEGFDLDGDKQLEIDLGDYLMTILFPDSKGNSYMHFYPKGDPAVDRQTGTYRQGLRKELLIAGKRIAHEARRRGWKPKLGNNEARRARIYSKVDWDISSLDPVTYDNDGNVIPLSQRFNQASDSILFQMAGERANYKTGSPVSTMAYRATPLKFGEAPKMASVGAFGSGIYTGGSIGMASYYLENDAASGESASGRRMASFSLNMRNPVVVRGDQFSALVDALNQVGINQEKATERIEKDLESKGGVGKWVQSAIQKAGHDGIIHIKNNNEVEFVSYNASSLIEVAEPNLFQKAGTQILSDSQVRSSVGMGLAMIDLMAKIGDGEAGLKELNKVRKDAHTVIDSYNKEAGKSVDQKAVQKAARRLINKFQAYYESFPPEYGERKFLVDTAVAKSFAIEDFGVERDSLNRANNIRNQQGLTDSEERKVEMQRLANELRNTFRNARSTNSFINAFTKHVSPIFRESATRIAKLMTRGVDNIMGAFNEDNFDLLERFVDNIKAYKGKEFAQTPEFIEEFQKTIGEVEGAIGDYLTRQFYAYNSVYMELHGIDDEIDSMIADMARKEGEGAIEHYNRIVKAVQAIEARMFNLENELAGTEEGQAISEKRKKTIRTKREKIGKIHQQSLLEKHPTFESYLSYRREKDGAPLYKMFEDTLRMAYDTVINADVEQLSDADIRLHNSIALTLMVGGNNTNIMVPMKRAWQAEKVESWKALVNSMRDRVGDNPLIRPIYRSAARNTTLKKLFNTLDKGIQAKVENFHVWVDRLSQYAPVRAWFDQQFFAMFQQGTFVEAENTKKAEVEWWQQRIKEYNDDTDNTADANPYLWVMTTLGQYNISDNPNKTFKKYVTKARTSIARMKQKNGSTMMVNLADRNLAALNYMLEGIDLESDTAYDQFMRLAETRIGANNEAVAQKRTELLRDVVDHFQLDIANQIFVREVIHGKEFTSVVNYMPLQTMNADGSPEQFDWTDLEPAQDRLPSSKNVNANANESRKLSLGQGRAYGMDFFNMIERKLVKNAIDKHSQLPVAILADMFKTELKVIDGAEYRVPKNDAIKEIFGTEVEVAGELDTIKEKITHQLIQVYGLTEPPSAFVSAIKKGLATVQAGMLSGVGQVAQQATAATVDYMAREEGNLTYMFDAIVYWSKNYQKVRDWMMKYNRDLYDRGNTQGIMEFERHINNAGSELGSLLDKTGRGIDEMRKFITLSLRYGDKLGAEWIFLAEHMKAVRNDGKLPAGAEYDIDDFTNVKYTTTANSGMARYIGTSSAAGRSYWMSDHKQAYFLLRSLTGAFQSSAHNMSSQILSAARNYVALQDDKSEQGRQERRAELRRIGSIMAQQATFTGVRHIVGAMMTYALVGALRSAYDDEEGAIAEAELNLQRVKKTGYPTQEAKDRALAEAERKLADLKTIRRAVVTMKQQASTDGLFKSMVRDQLQNLHIIGSVGDGFALKPILMVPNMMAEQSHKEAQDLVIKGLTRQRSEAIAMGDRVKAAQLAESISDARALEFIPFFYEKKDKSGFGGIIGGALDPIYSGLKEGFEDATRADRDFLTTRAFVPDLITYMSALGVGQADANRIAKQLQRLDDQLSKNREEVNERAAEKAEKLTNKP